MVRCHRSFVLLLPLALLSRPALAQAPDELPIGQRVRLMARCELINDRIPVCRDNAPSQSFVGQLERLDAGRVYLRAPSEDEALALPTAAVERVFVADGTRHHFWMGAGIGTLVGGVSGRVIGSHYRSCAGTCSRGGRGAILGGLGGFVIGGVLGSRVRTERWRLIVGPGLALELGF